MSQENVDVVRAMIERFNRDGFLPEELFDPEVELFNVRESPLPGPYRGYDGLRQWREGVFEVVEEGMRNRRLARRGQGRPGRLQDSPPGTRSAHAPRNRYRLDERGATMSDAEVEVARY
jgi:hypothetical protein